MSSLEAAVQKILTAQTASKKPLAVVLAGHNGSGKSTMWYERLADQFQIPLVNADRMMMSILPDASASGLPAWATNLRDANADWMQVAQRGVQAFVAQAMLRGVPFAMETVFSEWRPQPDGTVESKVNLIRQMQDAGYFVLLLFVGLSSDQVSIARVLTRIAKGGHAVDEDKLVARFPRTQQAIKVALGVADAAILVDNSRKPSQAFTVCHIRLSDNVFYDRRPQKPPTPIEILAWLEKIVPL